jgi:hypothetical protein
MKTSRRSFASHLAVGATALALAAAASSSFAGALQSTTNYGAWTVSTEFHGDRSGDGLLTSFNTDPANFTGAVERSDAPGWIANVATGSNGTDIGQWTFFVFQTTVDLTSQAELDAGLKFEWAADDSGQQFATRGAWTPKFSVNGGALIPGNWSDGLSYTLGSPTDLTAANGLQLGENTLLFYVEGNGITDGMSLVAVVPEPGSLGLFAAGLGLLGVMARRARRNAA